MSGFLKVMKRNYTLIILLTSLIFTVFIYLVFRQQASVSFKSYFIVDAQALSSMIKEKLDNADIKVSLLETFFESSEFVSRNEFKVFTDKLLENTSVEAFGWAPLVKNSGKISFEKDSLKAAGSENYIKELTADGDLVKAGERKEYYPALYIEPFSLYEFLMGLDVLSSEKVRDACAIAEQTGKNTATTIITLNNSENAVKGFILAAHVKKTGAASAEGFTGAFISVDKLVYNSINGLPREDFGLKIVDTTGAKEEIVYSDDAEYRDTLFHKLLHLFLYPETPVYENNFSFDGRNFKVIVLPTVEYLHKNHPKAYQYVLLIGLLFTFLIVNNVSLLANAEKNAVVLAEKMSADLNKKVKELDCFFEAGTDLMFITDLNGNMVKMNNAWEKVLGIKTDSAVKGKFFDLLHPDDKEKAIKTFSLVSNKKTSMEAVDRFLLPDGSFRWLEWRGVADEGIIYGIARDITDKKKDEERLRASENRFRTLAETAPIAIYTTDADGKCNYVNSLWKKLTGLTDEEAHGDGWAKSVMEEDKELLAKNWVNVQANRSNTGIEFRMKNKNGNTTWVYGSAAPIIDAGGAIQGFVGANIDITEVKNLPVVISMITTDWIIKLTEGMGLASFGLKAGHFVGMNAREMYKNHPALISAIESSFKGAEVEELLEIYGQVLKTFLTPVRNSNGEIIGAVIVSFNITESAKIQKEKDRMFAELEKKNAEMERFIYTVSHDLRNPLVTILGFAGMVKKALKEDNFALAVDSSNYIESAAHSMNDLIRDLLEISRIGRVVNAATPEPMRSIAEEAFKLNEKEIREYKIKVINEIDENITVNVDKKRMIEALYNLINNAVKFRAKTGNPFIKAGVLKDPVNGTVFFIEDNGIGIDKKYQHRIFTLFERLDQEIEGTGVGLPIVKRIIELHGGRLWLESEGEGKGSRFCFTINTEKPVV